MWTSSQNIDHKTVIICWMQKYKVHADFNHFSHNTV